MRAWPLALLVVACARPTTREAPLPATLPTSVPVAALAGAAACAECHREIYDAWSRSPHGRAMAPASVRSVLAPFSGAPVALADGTVTPSRNGDGYFMELRSASGIAERHEVDLVLASGRQHQVYVTRGPEGAYRLLPIIWCTRSKEWIPTSLYQSGGLDPRGPSYWARSDMSDGCFSCHLSQAYRATTPLASRWADLAIDCESCHGPARAHVAARHAGKSDDTLRDLKPLGPAEDARVCGQCHGFALKPYVFPRAADGLPEIFVTSLINDALRADGTQRLTSYQYPGHVLSQCFQKGALTCKGCHEPHGLGARNFLGETATGAQSNLQCTVCHRNRATVAEATRHSHHVPQIRCVDCHMSYSFIGDDDRRRQRTSDHSISIPRPRETLELGHPNACTACHRDRTPQWALTALARWGATRAGAVREWVRTIALARRRAPGATERLLALLDEPSAYLRASALDLLVIQPPDARVAPRLAPLARDEDPQLRSIAIRALEHHDAAGRARWIALGLADAHPFVRMETFSMVRDVATLPPEAIERALADTLAHMQPPTAGLVHLITVRHRRGELREALALVQLLARIALPYERDGLHLPDVRARLERQLENAGAR